MPADRPLPPWTRRLTELRRARAWSAADLARELKKLRDGLPSARSLAHMIQMDWETGKHRPGPRYRLLLAAVYDTDEQQIFGVQDASSTRSQPAGSRPGSDLAEVAALTEHGPYTARAGMESGATVFLAAARLCGHENSADGGHLAAEAGSDKQSGALTVAWGSTPCGGGQDRDRAMEGGHRAPGDNRFGMGCRGAE
jgi:transcriptional regulator with XRE-family HTH domain